MNDGKAYILTNKDRLMAQFLTLPLSVIGAVGFTYVLLGAEKDESIIVNLFSYIIVTGMVLLFITLFFINLKAINSARKKLKEELFVINPYGISFNSILLEAATEDTVEEFIKIPWVKIQSAVLGEYCVGNNIENHLDIQTNDTLYTIVLSNKFIGLRYKKIKNKLYEFTDNVQKIDINEMTLREQIKHSL